jgi:hypothetical protein
MSKGKKIALCLAAAGLMTGGCGTSTAEPAAQTKAEAPKPVALALPGDPVERAATCSGAYLARAQLQPGFEQNGISEEDMSRVIHPAYIDAGSSGQVEQGRLELSGNKSPLKAAEFRKNGKAEAAIAACEQAYPALRRGSFKALPADDVTARAVCAATAGALAQTYEATEGVRSERMPQIARLMVELVDPVTADFERKGITDLEAMNGELRRALAESMRSGPPGEVVTACLARFKA